MTLQDIIDYCRAVAIADSLSAGEEANYRYICRQYSKTFSTPLDQVYDMDPEEVCRAFFEDQMDSRDIEKDLETLLDIIYELEDPDYAHEKHKELKDFMKNAEEEERQRIAQKKPIHPGLRYESEVSLKNTTEDPPSQKKEPTGGFINLSYLADSDNEG